MRDDRDDIFASMTTEELNLYEQLGGDVPPALKRQIEQHPQTFDAWKKSQYEPTGPSQIALLQLAELNTPAARREFNRRYVDPTRY